MGFDRRFRRLRLAMAGAVLASPCFANLDRDSLDALKRLSIEELLQVEITSVSRTGESLRGAAAAISVVSPDIIRRTGATTVPDSLRLVPGIHVGQQTSSSWAVSARGFSSVTSEKLLVLSDTRSIYTPLFSGVLWDVQDYLLEDIERIEVIRGPGAALWGSNAVNGVINITTRSARDTHGTYLSAAAGSHERLELAARQGGETAGGLHYRVFAKYSDRDGTEHPDIVTDDDDWRFAHVGFRTDWDASSRDSFTVQGDAYRGEIGQIAPVVQIIGRPGPASPLELQASGGNLLARWRRSSEDSADMQLRVYYDYTRRDDPSFLDTLHTVDIDFQQQLAQLGRHEVIWGTSYRVTDNRNRRGEVFAVVPEDSTDHLFSGFIQDQIAFSDQVRLTLGTKLEHNDFSGFEVQPSVRVAWSPEEAHTLWSAISRAVRVPTRLERDISVDATDPAGNPVARLLGNDDFDSEELIAYEAGYRWQPLSNLSTDLALFYNDYQKLVSLEFAEPFLQDDGRIIVPIVNENLGDGATRGVEIQVEWSPLPYWHLTGSYSYLDMQLGSSGQDLNRNEWYEDSTPRHLAGLRSFLTLGERFEIDAQLRHQSRIRAISEDIARTGIDAYTELDLRLAWRVNEDWDLSLVGQNLLDDSHLEFGSPGDRGGIERSAYLKAEWHN